jgi:hypothetical protein
LNKHILHCDRKGSKNNLHTQEILKKFFFLIVTYYKKPARSRFFVFLWPLEASSQQPIISQQPVSGSP